VPVEQPAGPGRTREVVVPLRPPDLSGEVAS
jgi:hypothetical protein